MSLSLLLYLLDTPILHWMLYSYFWLLFSLVCKWSLGIIYLSLGPVLQGITYAPLLLEDPVKQKALLSMSGDLAAFPLRFISTVSLFEPGSFCYMIHLWTQFLAGTIKCFISTGYDWFAWAVLNGLTSLVGALSGIRGHLTSGISHSASGWLHSRHRAFAHFSFADSVHLCKL